MKFLPVQVFKRPADPNYYFHMIGPGVIIWFIAGAGLITIAACMTYDHLKFRRQSKSAIGTIVDFVSGSEYTVKHPIVEFVDDKRNTIRFRVDFGTNLNIWKIGGKVLVRYLPHEPETARIDKFPANWFFTIVFYFIGFVFVWIALMVRVQR